MFLFFVGAFWVSEVVDLPGWSGRHDNAYSGLELGLVEEINHEGSEEN